MRIVLLTTLVACSSAAPSSTTPTVASPSQPAVGGSDPSPPPFRLPGDVRPIRYRLDQTIVPTADKVTGQIHIDAQVVHATRVVWLNATDITVDHAELAGKTARIVPGGDDFVGLIADAEIPTGLLAIDVSYKAGIDRDKARGIYAQKEGETGETYAYTFFEATDARRAFPCFDEPAYKVPWTLVFHIHKDHVALANAPVVKETDEPNGMKRVEIAESKPLPSYLVAFVVGPFEVIDDGTAGRIKTPIRFIIPKGRAGELGYAKEVTPKVLVALERYFDMDYPYGKLDVAVVPRFWGTMEHPGIVAMGQPLTLIRPEETSRDRKERYANILAHEMSHYWFGDLVTMKWWDDTWLNEALGEWSDMNITEAAEPTWRFRDNRFQHAWGAMEADEKLSSHAIRRPVTTRTDIEASFDGDITYNKGATVFRMLEAFVGRDKWRGFIHGYLSKHAWGNASADDFIADMAATLGAPVADSFRTFLDQPGVPLVEVTPHCADPLTSSHGAPNTLVLHQQRSLPAGVTEPTERLWKVPVCMRYGDAKSSSRVCKLLDKATDTVDVASCPTWVVPNDDGLGYYRSKIDVALVKRELARGSGASPVEKMMSIIDLRAAVDRGDVTIDKVFEIAPVVLADSDDKVAQMAPGTSSFPSNALDEPLYKAKIRYDLKVYGPVAARLGWTRGKNDSDERNRLRNEALSIVGRWDAKLGAQAEKLADHWVADHTGIDNDLVDAALWIAAFRGDAARFDRYLDAARKARDREVQQRLLRQLGNFRDPALAKRALDLVLDGSFDLRDSLAIAWGVIGGRDNRELGFTWFKDHVDELLAKMRSDEASWLLSGVAGSYCDPEHRDAIAAIVKPRTAKIDGADNYVNRALEGDDQCISYVARQLPSLKAFLKP